MDKFFVLALSVLVLTACNNGTSTDIDDVDTLQTDSIDNLQLFTPHQMSASVDNYFSDFFYAFLTDENFQKERIGKAIKSETKGIAKRFNTQEFYTVIYTDDHQLAMQNDTSLQEVSVSWITMYGDVDRYVFKKLPETNKWMLTEVDDDAKVERDNRDFFLFYRDFATDFSIQTSSLHDPILFMVSQSEESEEDAESGDGCREISVSEWADFVQENDLPMLTGDIVSIDFGQNMKSSDTKNLLLQEFCNGNTIIMRFAKEKGAWKLNEIDV